MKALLIIAVYITLGCFTGSWVFDSWVFESPAAAGQRVDRMAGAIAGGVFWPLYWTTSVSSKVVHGLRSTCQ